MKKVLVPAVIAVCVNIASVLAAAETKDAFLADRHAEYGSCSICHEEEKPEQGAFVDWAECMECHGEYAELGARTQSFGEWNPHDNHPGETDCTLCHMGHTNSSLFCATCHNNLDPEMK
jgi:fumarate reductase flavoprotein subunit